MYAGTGTLTKYYFAGGAYEVQDDGTTTTTRVYYSIAGQRVAMEEDDGSTQTVYYFVNDHLSSASVVTDDSGTLLSENRYTPFGEVRDLPASMSTDDPITETDFGYTGQRDLGGVGLMDYNARFYSPTLGRFIQPDKIVPNPYNSQSWNRYSYVRNSPIMYSDPTGHRECTSSTCDGSDDTTSGEWLFQLNGYNSCYRSPVNPLCAYHVDAIHKDVQEYVAQQAELVNTTPFTDLDAMENIFNYVYSMTGENYEWTMVLIASAFFREELLPLGMGGFAGPSLPSKIHNYSYKDVTTEYRFGVSGFDETYYGEDSNKNQIEHFFGEALLTLSYGGYKFIGQVGVFIQDPGSTASSTADRNLGNLAVWWVNSASDSASDPLELFNMVLDIISTGGSIP